MYTKTTVETAIGTVEVTITEANHAYLECTSAVVNGVAYHVSGHFGRYDDTDGKFIPQREAGMHAIHLRRADHKPWSFAARDKAKAILTAAINTVAEQQARLFDKAEVQSIAREIERKQTKHAELIKEAFELEQEIAGLTAKLNAR